MKKIGLVLVLWFCGNCFSQEVTHLKIEGNEKTKAHFIRKISNLAQGTSLDSLIIKKDINRLKQLPGISHADYTVTKNKDGNYTVTYRVEENYTLLPSANFYTTNNDEFAFKIGLHDFNAFGQNITIGGSYQYDIYNSFSINFRAPYLFSNKFGIAFTYNNQTTLEPVFFNDTQADYKYNNRSHEILGLYEYKFHHNFQLGFNYFVETYDYVEGATDPNVPQYLKERKVLFKFNYRYHKLDYYYYLVNGYTNTFYFQFITRTDGDSPGFVIGWNDFNYYKRVGEKGNWANRLRVGAATNNDTPFAPFALDNNVNIRGVGNVIDRGTGVIVINTEYRQTLFEKNWFVLQGNAFIDSGTWRNPGGSLSDFWDSENIRVYPGLGIRFIHKRIFNAIFRIDYGYGITKDATHGLVFGIGQYF